MKDSTRKVLRTAVQYAIAVAVVAPEAYTAATGNDPASATGWVAIGLGICVAITRVMALRKVDLALSRIGLGSASKTELQQ
jgi:hypothetical protein